jgi:hypothetical protein
MQPHTKKMIVMTAISLSIVMSAYVIPVYVVPAAIAMSQLTSCTSYGCANTVFTRCGGFSTSEQESDFMSSWTKGMEGMMCMMGIGDGSPGNASGAQITLNKV